jgi:hypothetical protein
MTACYGRLASRLAPVEPIGGRILLGNLYPLMAVGYVAAAMKSWAIARASSSRLGSSFTGAS